MEIRGGVAPRPVILLLSHKFLLGAVDWDVAPHMGRTTLSITISRTNMAAVMWNPCATRVTHPMGLQRVKSLSAPGGCNSAGVPGHSVWGYGQLGINVTEERRRRRGTKVGGRPWPAPVTPVASMWIMNVAKFIRGCRSVYRMVESPVIR